MILKGSVPWDAPVPVAVLDTRRAEDSRCQRGKDAYFSGIAAEMQVAMDYRRRGARILHQRWRGKAGEIDLIARQGNRILFVEVKKSRDFDRAVSHLTSRQIDRLCLAAQEFMGAEPGLSGWDMRLDVALVDQFGALRILENALA